MRKRRLIPLVAGVLGTVWLAAQALFQVFVAEAPRPAFYLLNAANLLQVAVTLTALAVLLVTNTRRPRGIEPDDVPPPREVIKEVWHDLDSRPYGRRESDVPVADVRRVLAAVRGIRTVEEDSDHTSADQPPWAQQLLHEQAPADEHPEGIDLEAPVMENRSDARSTNHQHSHD